MNLFTPPKFVKGVYFRENEKPFVLLSQFVCNATRQKWSNHDIQRVCDHARSKDHRHFIEIMKAHMH